MNSSTDSFESPTTGAATRGAARRARLAALFVTALSACRRTPPPAPPAPPAAPAQAPAVARNPEEITPATALETFAGVYGPVPGVAASTHPSGFGCGVEALRRVAAHWSSLRPEQQAAVRAAVESPLPRTARRDLAELVSRGAAAQAGGCCGGDAPPAIAPLTDEEQADAQRIVDGLRSELSTMLHHTPRLPFKVYREAPRAPADSYPLASDSERLPTWITGLTNDTTLSSASLCRIRIRREWLTGMPRASLRMVLGHEVFHCFQYDTFVGTRGEQLLAFEDLRPWAFEGAAAYVGERLSGGTTLDGCWLRGYFSQTPAAACVQYALHSYDHPAGPGVFSLYRAGYDAIGYFATLEGLGLDPLAASDNGVANILRVVNDASSDVALARLSQHSYVQLVDVASASTRRGWGRSWRIDSALVQPGPELAREAPRVPPIAHGSPAHLQLESGAMQVIDVPFGGAPYVRVRGTGHGHVAFDRSLDRIYVNDVNLVFCREWPCMCPDGRPVPRATGQIPAGVTSFTLAHTAVPRERADLTLDTPSVEELCGATPPDAGPPPALTGFDPCLTGTWHIDRAREMEVMRATFPSQIRVRNVRGDLQLRFDGRGGGGAYFNRYCIETETTSATPMQQRVIFDGQGTGRYTASNGRLSTRDFVPSLQVHSEVTVAGRRLDLPVPANDAMARAAVPGTGGYTCSATELRFTDSRGTRYVR